MDDFDVWEANQDESDWPYYSVSGRLSKDSMNDWLARDKWNYYEAASMFSGYIPNSGIKVIATKRFVFSIGGEMTDEDVDLANQMLALFESAEWSKYGASSEACLIDQQAYKNFLEDKSVPINGMLKHALSDMVPLLLTPRMSETLQPVINLILKFQTSKHYKDYLDPDNKSVTKLNKESVNEWLVGKPYRKKGVKGREGFVLADLILDYYNSIP